MSTLESDLWKQLLAEAGEAEIDATASVTVKEAEAELTAAGFDVAAERAKASAFLDALEDGTLDTEPQAPHSGAAVAVAQDPPPVHRTRRQRPVVFWLGAAAAARTDAAASPSRPVDPGAAPVGRTRPHRRGGPPSPGRRRVRRRGMERVPREARQGARRRSRRRVGPCCRWQR